jgi:hypothetical protein
VAGAGCRLGILVAYCLLQTALQACLIIVDKNWIVIRESESNVVIQG